MARAPAHNFAVGQATPWIGNAAADLVTVHVSFGGLKPSDFVLHGPYSTFTNATVVEGVTQFAPGSCKLGNGQLWVGNEVLYVDVLSSRFDTQWKCLPGKLQVMLYSDKYGLQAAYEGGTADHLATGPIDTVAGKEYYYEIVLPHAFQRCARRRIASTVGTLAIGRREE